MNKCLVYFRDGILKKDYDRVLIAISMIRGVDTVKMDYSADVTPVDMENTKKDRVNERQIIDTNNRRKNSKSSQQYNPKLERRNSHSQTPPIPQMPAKSTKIEQPSPSMPQDFSQNTSSFNEPPLVEPSFPSDFSNIAPTNPKIPPESNSFVNTNAQQQSNPQQVSNQRKIISAAIKWGIYNKKIKIEKIRNASPQEIVDLAKTIIEEMPEQEREKFLNM